MSLKLNKQIQNSELFTSVKSTLKKSFYYSAVAATALGTSISFLPTTQLAHSKTSGTLGRCNAEK